MMKKDTEKISIEQRAFYYQNGKIYFSQKVERTFYFIVALALLVAGFFYKCNLM